ncbi:hypothetical protein Skr01_35090 [Sphaerisporangium krabiense]|uniref:Cytochrome c-type biogenesis protein CcmH/NrfF n=1 Tax=Sphaerisporangium krabiense TaxID=763782 RepID=A0A7W8Z3J5_9ACTN|nr:DUF6203 family protein [Sphaerisporangium krabiense]MBB5626503.1 cytochrome c-type biogenesis protein CcmH/NrfF [Sphaerisporangium krabiense]GII63424.1 hypothetical protein Skr01_35090 [Sphaerisporangium krabiense]
MKRILQLLVTRWLARTPVGLVILGVGWWLTRRRRAGKAAPPQDVPREPGRGSRDPYARTAPSRRGRG